MPFERTGNPTTTSFAALNTIDFSRIAKGEPAEVGKLLQSCQTHGFFYLDLTKGPSSQLLQDVDPLLRLMEGYFGQPLEMKARDDLSSMTLGYGIPIPTA
jgi:isopenicillin N synthase-like dioxygenase